MSTWKPIETAPKDRMVDFWSKRGVHITNICLDGAMQLFDDLTHWKESDKGPGQEDGEVRWMVASEWGLGRLAFTEAEAARMAIDQGGYEHPSVVRVRIVREEE